jgi:hypothetical protein
MPAGLPWPGDPHLRRWMSFVDGENFTIRGQELATAKGIALVPGGHFQKDVFVWFPGLAGRANILSEAPLKLQPAGIRAHYYTSMTGDDVKMTAVREALWKLGFQPEVFKKDSQTKKSKGVDVALTTDFLWNAFQDNYDVAILVAGDGDYVPMVNAAKRLGKVVYVAFFYDSGLAPALRLASDESFRIDDAFCDRWKEQLPNAV